MANKIGRVVTYNKNLPTIKPHDSLIPWSCDNKRQTKNITTLNFLKELQQV